MADVRLVQIPFKQLVFLDGEEGRKKNPRKIEAHNLQKLAAQIQADENFLIARPPLVSFSNGQYLVYAGHQRATACGKILKWKEIMCSVENDVPDDVMAKRAILDNTHSGEWDAELLLDFGFSSDELYDLNVSETIFDFGHDFHEDGSGKPDNSKYTAEEDDFEVPEAETVKTDIVLGDLFELTGKNGLTHRLLCGDSTKSEDIEKLMGEEKAELCLTDPPYGISLKYVGVMANNTDGEIIGDDSPFDPSMILSIGLPCYYLFGADYYIEKLPTRKGLCVWAKAASEKENLVFGASFETFWRSKKQKREVWFETRINALPENMHAHPTQKPVKLFTRCIEDSETKGAIVDFFIGSGTAMVAAHQLNRRCFGMELSPKYVQTTLNRILKLDPSLEVNKNGVPYQNINS